MTRMTEALVRAIVRAEKPRHIRLFESAKRNRVVPRSASGLTEIDINGNIVVRVPVLKSASALFICMHEFGHVRLGHMRIYGNGATDHVVEYDAEQFAIAKMHEYGLPVSKSDLGFAKWRVREWIKRDEKMGVLKIKPHIRRWARSRA